MNPSDTINCEKVWSS